MILGGEGDGDKEAVRHRGATQQSRRMRNRAAWELTERHQSLVTRTETLIYELHSAGAAETDGRGKRSAAKTLFTADENPLQSLP